MKKVTLVPARHHIGGCETWRVDGSNSHPRHGTPDMGHLFDQARCMSKNSVESQSVSRDIIYIYIYL